MTVKDVLKCACEFIDRHDLCLLMDQGQDSDEKEVEKLLSFFNLVEEEIASEFMPLYKEELLNKENKVFFKDLSEDLLRVKAVKDLSGRKMSFTLFPDHITFKGRAGVITYSYIPSKKTIDDEVSQNLPARIYAYAVLREHFLSQGLTDFANLYESRFKLSLDLILSKRVLDRMPAPVWI